MIRIQLSFALVLIVVVVAVVSLIHKRGKHLRYKEQLRQWQARNPNPALHCETAPPAPAPKGAWTTAGTVLAAVAAVGGLAILAGAVLLFVVLSSGSFKFGNK